MYVCMICICTGPLFFQVPITFSDLEFVDDELYKHLKHLKKISNAQKVSPAAFSIASLLLDFTVTYETKDKYDLHMYTYIHINTYNIYIHTHTFIYIHTYKYIINSYIHIYIHIYAYNILLLYTYCTHAYI